MIVDQLINSYKYHMLSKRIATAFNYLHTNDFSQLSDGEYPIEDRDIFAMVNTYAPKPAAAGQLEAHRRYIDIQFLVSGRESIGYAPLERQRTVTAYDAERDLVFYAGASTLMQLKAGMVAIFFPEDLHMPSIGDPSEVVRKVVVKVHI